MLKTEGSPLGNLSPEWYENQTKRNGALLFFERVLVFIFTLDIISCLPVLNPGSSTDCSTFHHRSFGFLILAYSGHYTELQVSIGFFRSLECRQTFFSLLLLTLWTAIISQFCKFLCFCISSIKAVFPVNMG